MRVRVRGSAGTSSMHQTGGEGYIVQKADVLVGSVGRAARSRKTRCTGAREVFKRGGKEVEGARMDAGGFNILGTKRESN